MTHEVEVFWSYRSPFSYLAIPDILSLPKDYDLTLTFRPVYPLAIRQPEFFGPARRVASDYIRRDWVRRAEFLGRPFAKPEPDPVSFDHATNTPAPDQPYIHWLTKLGIEAARHGRGAEFAAEVSGLIFGGTKGWDKGDHLAGAARKCGLELSAMRTAIETGDHGDEIEANQAALARAGHWGVPTFVFRAEPFFGQDRVETLRWRLDRSGVPRRRDHDPGYSA